MTPADRYTSSTYIDANPDYHLGEAAWKAQRCVELLGDRAPRGLICDVGCGAGHALAAMLDLLPGARGIGYDISQPAIDAGRAIYPDLDLRVGGGPTPDDPERIDVLTCFDVIEHVDDYYGLLRRLRDANAARYVFHVPLEYNALLAVRQGRLKEIRDQVGHIHHFSPMTTEQTLLDAGFVVEELAVSRVPAYGRVQRVMGVARAMIDRLSPITSSNLLGGHSAWVLASSAD